jgi:ribosome maturation protein Sdo1
MNFFEQLEDIKKQLNKGLEQLTDEQREKVMNDAKIHDVFRKINESQIEVNKKINDTNSTFKP